MTKRSLGATPSSQQKSIPIDVADSALNPSVRVAKLKPRVHLLALPWTKPNYPSIQIASLKAYVDASLGPAVRTHAYSAYLPIYFNAFSASLFEKFQNYHDCGELSYLLVYAKNFIDPSLSYKRLAEDFNHYNPTARIDAHDLFSLEQATFAFLENILVPNLDKRVPNIIGFTLNYSQVYASLCCLEYLKSNYGSRPMIFLFGGMSAVQPQVLKLFKRLEIDAYFCAGEGEQKLVDFVRDLKWKRVESKFGNWQIKSSQVNGVFHVADNIDLYERDSALYVGQLEKLGTLPAPDYSEYFESLKRLCLTDATFEALKSSISYILVEGSRGCFAKCDFCGLNYLWEGFRTRKPDEVLTRTLDLVSTHHVPAVNFVDNVTDAWAHRFARTIISARSGIKSFLEIRANHPFAFWVRLYLAGVEEVQVGIEAISMPLLARINKGTTVLQNLRVHKYLHELDIKCFNNLITHHVHSSMNDIRETKRILGIASHFRPFSLAHFGLQVGSPIYEELERAQKESLIVQSSFPRSSVPEFLHEYLIDYYFEPTDQGSYQRRVSEGWDRFTEWYSQTVEAQKEANPFLRIRPYNFQDKQFSLIEDGRSEELQITEIQDIESLVYQYCHDGKTEADIAARFGLEAAKTRRILRKFLSKKWMVKIGQDYLSLAIRPKNVVLNEFIVGEYERDQNNDTETRGH